MPGSLFVPLSSVLGAGGRATLPDVPFSEGAPLRVSVAESGEVLLSADALGAPGDATLVLVSSAGGVVFVRCMLPVSLRPCAGGCFFVVFFFGAAAVSVLDELSL